MSEGLENFINSIQVGFGEILTEDEVSKLLGFSKMYLLNLRSKPHAIPFIRFGRNVKYFKIDLIKWIRTCKALTDGKNYPNRAAGSPTEKGKKEKKAEVQRRKTSKTRDKV